MSRHEREVVHGLAEQYGLASSSYKAEPQRYVQLFKLPASSIPNKSVCSPLHIVYTTHVLTRHWQLQL